MQRYTNVSERQMGKKAGEGGKEAGEGGKEAGEGGKEAGEGVKEAGEGGEEAGEGGKEAGEGGKEAGESILHVSIQYTPTNIPAVMAEIAMVTDTVAIIRTLTITSVVVESLACKGIWLPW